MKQTISILTATYNRKKLLERLYNSLQKQTDLNFEWVVIDDGSTDGTDKWMEEIKNKAEFAIKYKVVPHGGKLRAVNVGVIVSEGEYIFMVDSDDWLPDNSIEIVNRWIENIRGYDYLAGVSGIMVDSDNKIIGDRPKLLSEQYVECSNLERYRMNLMGDKAEIYKREILEKYPFPCFEGENFITERIIWDKIAHDGYKIRWYNEPIYICEYQENGLSNSGANKTEGHLKNYKGYVEFIKQSVRIMEMMEAVTYFREYNDTAKIIGKSIRDRALEIDFGIIHYLAYLYVVMPVNYLRRIICGLTRI